MAKSWKKKNPRNEEIIEEPGNREEPRSRNISKNGIKTGEDFARLMSAMMEDVVLGKISPEVANATCNAGGKFLKVVEMQYKYANQPINNGSKTLKPPPLSLTGE